jgi:ComF family protein
MRHFLADFIDLFYPRVCAACFGKLNKAETDICLNCKTSLPRTGFHLFVDNPVQKIFWGRIELESAFAYYYFTKNSKVQNILHHIKYTGYKELAVTIGREYGLDLKKAGALKKMDYIVPVPLHPKKLKARGFNQSEYFGMGLSEATGIPLSANNLVRQVHSSTQTRKSRFQRWENVSDIFAVLDPAEFDRRHLLLVDDVITTGSTIEACYLALKKSSNVKLSIASMAIASNQ